VRRAGRTFWILATVAVFVLILYLITYPDLFFSRLVVPILPRLGLRLPEGYDYEMENLAERTDYTAVARNLIATEPVLGVGSGNFSIASIRHNPIQAANHAFLPVHNVLLLITAELGLSGGLAWLLLIGGWLAATARRWRQLTSDPWFLAWSLALWGLLLTSVWDFYIWGWQYGRLFFFAALGLWSAAYPRQ
jgi:O-antigen ligase